MEHRNLVSQSQTSETENGQMWNHQPSDPRHGTGSVMLPSDNVAVWRSNSVAYHNTGPRANVLPLPNFSSEAPSFMRGVTGAAHDSFMHQPAASDSFQFPPYYVQHRPCYNQVGFGNVRVTTSPQTDYERATYKRKIPAISDFDRGDINGYYGAGSSSNPTSIEHFQTKPMISSQYWPRDPLSLHHNYRSNNMPTLEEGSQRNVRSRHGSALHLETVPPGVHSTMSQDLHSVASTSGPVVAVQWSHTPVSLEHHAMVNSSEISSFNHELDHSHSRGVSYVHNGNVEIGGICHPNFVPGRTFTPLPAHNGLSTGGLVAGRGNYDQRTAFRTNIGYPSMAAAASVEDVRIPRLESAVLPRYARPPSILGHSHDRSGRMRPSYNRYHSFSEEGTHSRWASEGVVMTEQLNFYDSRSLFDQHQDMRLDIDNMSYEELLALEERIGYVSTGLSEDAISSCLMESIYCPSDHIQDDQEEEKCAICLEAYQDRVQVGRLRCGHDFHASCITQWLLIKNVCPICKSSALEDASQKQ